MIVYTDSLPGFRPIAEGVARLRNAEKVIGHNVVKFDVPMLNQFFPGTIRREQVVDTLVMYRLHDPEERQNSLEAIGLRMGILKGTFSGPWDRCTREMMEYAAQDVVVTRAAYHKVRVVETWGQSFQLEMDVAWAIAAQERNGFLLDVPKAQNLEAELRQELSDMTGRLQEVFPPVWVKLEEFTPKGDNRAYGYNKGCPLTKVALQEFNPGSRPQVGKRLMALGWEPVEFGQDGYPTIDEDVLGALPYPQAQELVHYFQVQKLLGQLSDGKNGWLKLVRPSGRVHGAVNPNGACTGRMSHFQPNMAQVSSDHRARELWIPRPGWKLVGVDAEGLEARILGHFLWPFDNGAYSEMLLNGDKSKGTDVHSSNARAVNGVGLKVNRDGAKTLLYALIYGAGDRKLGLTVIENVLSQGLSKPRGAPFKIGRKVRAALATSMVGIDKLVEKIHRTMKANGGWLRGIDGRRLPVRSQHSALNTLCQSAGAIVMKQALVMFMEANCIRKEEHGVLWALCANVHDEVQIEAHPSIAADLGKAFANCIEAAGRDLGIRCPLAGQAKVGANWSLTH